jgi:hypothetical protein
MTDTQRSLLDSRLEEAGWDLDQGVVLRRLLQKALGESFDMESLLKQYYKLPSSQKTPAMVKSYKTSVRLSYRDWVQFRDLADKWARTSAAVAEILVELFIAGVIKKSDIWE